MNPHHLFLTEPDTSFFTSCSWEGDNEIEVEVEVERCGGKREVRREEEARSWLTAENNKASRTTVSLNCNNEGIGEEKREEEEEGERVGESVGATKVKEWEDPFRENFFIEEETATVFVLVKIEEEEEEEEEDEEDAVTEMEEEGSIENGNSSLKIEEQGRNMMSFTATIKQLSSKNGCELWYEDRVVEEGVWGRGRERERKEEGHRGRGKSIPLWFTVHITCSAAQLDPVTYTYTPFFSLLFLL